MYPDDIVPLLLAHVEDHTVTQNASDVHHVLHNSHATPSIPSTQKSRRTSLRLLALLRHIGDQTAQGRLNAPQIPSFAEGGFEEFLQFLDGPAPLHECGTDRLGVADDLQTIATHGHALAGDIAGFIRGQVDDDGGDMAWMAVGASRLHGDPGLSP